MSGLADCDVPDVAAVLYQLWAPRSKDKILGWEIDRVFYPHTSKAVLDSSNPGMWLATIKYRFALKDHNDRSTTTVEELARELHKTVFENHIWTVNYESSNGVYTTFNTFADEQFDKRWKAYYDDLLQPCVEFHLILVLEDVEY